MSISVHPSSFVDPKAELSEGVEIGPLRVTPLLERIVSFILLYQSAIPRKISNIKAERLERL